MIKMKNVFPTFKILFLTIEDALNDFILLLILGGLVLLSFVIFANSTFG